jgi:hypothetical protein
MMIAEEDAVMQPQTNANVAQLVLVRPEPPGQYTAQLVGLPELCATAATRNEALRQVDLKISEWLKSGQLAVIQAPMVSNPSMDWSGRIDPNDTLEKEFLDELARMKQEDLEETLRANAAEDAKCSSSSSTPTT